MLFFVPLILAIAVFGQIAVSTPHEPAPHGDPVALPERTAPIASDPETIYAVLLSGNLVERDRVFESLGLEPMEGQQPTDIRLAAVNLDSDEALERVLTVTTNSWIGVAVFDRQGTAWRRIGSFLCCGSNASPARDPFVEIRQTVWSGVNDIIVHIGGSFGTGVGQSSLSIYRVWRGRLYKVFDAVESAYNWTSSEESTFRFPDADGARLQSIAVQRSQKVRTRSSVSCTVHRWDAQKFSFVPLPTTPGACAKVR